MTNQASSSYQANPRAYAQALSCLVASINALGEAANPLNVKGVGALVQPSDEVLNLCIEDAFSKELSALPAPLAQGLREDLSFKLFRDALTVLNPDCLDLSFRLEGLSERLQACGFKLFIKKPDGARLEWFPQVEVLSHQKLLIEKI